MNNEDLLGRSKNDLIDIALHVGAQLPNLDSRRPSVSSWKTYRKQDILDAIRLAFDLRAIQTARVACVRDAMDRAAEEFDAALRLLEKTEDDSPSESVTCGECKFCIFKDYGYSSWTVENTVFFCAKKLHPEDGFDRFYGTDVRLNHASVCRGFEKGEAIEIDVDREVEHTPEELAIIAAWEEDGGDEY